MADENTFDVSLLDNESHRSAAIEKLTGSGFVVKSSDDYNASMSDYLKGLSPEDERVGHIVNPIVRRERESVESMVKSLFPDAQKASVDGKTETAVDFAGRMFKSKIEELNEKAKKGISSEQVVKDFDDFKQTSSNEMKKLKSQLQEKEREILQKDVTFDLNTSISKREGKFSKDERVAPLIPTHVESVRRQALEQNPEFRQIGDSKVLVFIDENGSIKYKDGNPYTVDVFVNEALAPILETGRQMTGTGTKSDDDKNNSGAFNIPAEITNQVQLDDYIQNTLKLNFNDSDVITKRAEIIKSRKLPLQ